MFLKISFAATLGIVVIVSQPCLSAEQLPIADGVYLRDQEQCVLFEKNELDFVDLEIEKNGRAYSLPEVGCLVASANPVRENRFHVEGDCLEAGDLWQHSFFLDVVSSTNIRMDGEDLMLCQSSDISDSPPLPIARPEPASSTPLSLAQELIESWHEENENCRGGSGDDPETQKACDRRGEIGAALDKLNMCYGTNSHRAYQYEWHRCHKDSIRNTSER